MTKYCISEKYDISKDRKIKKGEIRNKSKCNACEEVKNTKQKIEQSC